MDDDPRRIARLLLLSAGLLLVAGCKLPHVRRLSDPLSAQEHLNLGVAYEQDGRYADAEKQFRKALEGGLPQARVNLANVAFLSGDFARAETLYREALAHDPQNATACNNLAWLYHSQGVRREEAIRLAEKAVELSPETEAFRHTLETLRAQAAPLP